MFRSFGEFRKVPCPEKNCTIPYCQFSHDPNCVQYDFYSLVEREASKKDLEKEAKCLENWNNNFSKIPDVPLSQKPSILNRSIFEKSMLENSMNDSAIASELEISMDEEAVRREHAKWMSRLQAKKQENARKRSNSPDSEKLEQKTKKSNAERVLQSTQKTHENVKKSKELPIQVEVELWSKAVENSIQTESQPDLLIDENCETVSVTLQTYV